MQENLAVLAGGGCGRLRVRPGALPPGAAGVGQAPDPRNGAAVFRGMQGLASGGVFVPPGS